MTKNKAPCVRANDDARRKQARKQPTARHLQRALVAGVGTDVIKHGAAAAAAARTKDPLGYLKFANTLVHENKPARREASPVDRMTDQQLEARIAYYDEKIAAVVGEENPASGDQSSADANAASGTLPALSEAD